MTAAQREQLVRAVITPFWETSRRKNSPTFTCIENPKFKYLVGKFKDEGYFIILSEDGQSGQLDVDTYRQVLAEARKAGLQPPYHVYARYEVYQSPNVYFNQVPSQAARRSSFDG